MNQRHASFYQEEAARYHNLRYGSWYGSIVAETHDDILREILSHAPHPRVILDVASGTGLNLKVLREAGDLIIASDLTTEMLDAARKRLGPEKGVSYLRCDALKIPFPDGTLDLVTSSRFLHLLDDARQKEVMLEVLRVLKPGGILVLDFFNRFHGAVLALPIMVYRALLRKRPTESRMNPVGKTVRWMKGKKIHVAGTVGVGSYFLVLSWIFPRSVSMFLARLFKKGPLKVLAEQTVIIGEKQG